MGQETLSSREREERTRKTPVKAASNAIRAHHNYGEVPRCVLHFTGKERDAESGLDNFGARHYEGSSGRFVSPDPKIITRQRLVDPQQWDMYAYARDNPLLFIDPDGRELKLYIYNNTAGRLSDQQLATAGSAIAAKFQSAGVKNVSYRIVGAVAFDNLTWPTCAHLIWPTLVNSSLLGNG